MTADELKKELQAAGWSQRTFAARLGCDQDTVSRWCTGKTPVPASVKEYLRVIKLAREILK
mgnify:CR=1 FL=1